VAAAPLIAPGPDDVVLIDVEGVLAALVVVADKVACARAFALGAVKPAFTVTVRTSCTRVALEV
jgi:hypothetical protein